MKQLLLDSGAFSLQKTLEKSFARYLEFVGNNIEIIDLVANMDKFYDSTHIRKESLEEYKRVNLTHFEELHKIVPPEKLIYPFHWWLLDELDYFKEVFDRFPDISYVGIGCAKLSDASGSKLFFQLERFYEMLERSGKSDVRVHLFGCGNIEAIKHFKPQSVDCTSWYRSIVCSNTVRYYDEFTSTVQSFRVGPIEHTKSRQDFIKFTEEKQRNTVTDIIDRIKVHPRFNDYLIMLDLEASELCQYLINFFRDSVYSRTHGSALPYLILLALLWEVSVVNQIPDCEFFYASPNGTNRELYDYLPFVSNTLIAFNGTKGFERTTFTYIANKKEE